MYVDKLQDDMFLNMRGKGGSILDKDVTVDEFDMAIFEKEISEKQLDWELLEYFKDQLQKAEDKLRKLSKIVKNYEKEKDIHVDEISQLMHENHNTMNQYIETKEKLAQKEEELKNIRKRMLSEKGKVDLLNKTYKEKVPLTEAEKEELVSKIKQLQVENDMARTSIKEEIEKNEEAIKYLEDRLNKKEDEIKRLQKKINVERGKADLVTKTNNCALKSDIRELERQLNKVKTAKDKAFEEASEMREELKKLRASSHEISTSKIEYEQEKSTLVVQISKLEVERDSMKEKLAIANSEIETHKVSLKETKLESEKRISDLQFSLTRAEKKITTLERELSLQSKSSTSIEKKLRQSLEAAYSERDKAVKEMTQKSSEFQKHLESSMNGKSEYETEKTKLIIENKQLELERGAIKEELAKAHSEIEAIHNSYKEKLSELSAKSSRAESEFKKVERELEMKNNSFNSVDIKMRQDLDSAHVEIKNLKESYIALKRNHDELVQTNEELIKEKMHSEAMNREKIAELSELRVLRLELESSKKAHEEEKEHLHNRLKTLKEELEKGRPCSPMVRQRSPIRDRPSSRLSSHLSHEQTFQGDGRRLLTPYRMSPRGFSQNVQRSENDSSSHKSISKDDSDSSSSKSVSNSFVPRNNDSSDEELYPKLASDPVISQENLLSHSEEMQKNNESQVAPSMQSKEMSSCQNASSAIQKDDHTAARCDPNNESNHEKQDVIKICDVEVITNKYIAKQNDKDGSIGEVVSDSNTESIENYHKMSIEKSTPEICDEGNMNETNDEIRKTEDRALGEAEKSSRVESNQTLQKLKQRRLSSQKLFEKRTERPSIIQSSLPFETSNGKKNTSKKSFIIQSRRDSYRLTQLQKGDVEYTHIQ